MTLQVFISYKSEYRDFARSVKNELNEWGFETWLDVDNIQPGDYFRHKIQEGLDSSDVLLMVLTEEAQLSREVMAEVDYFLDVAKKPVVPLRHRECKPLYIFVSIQYIDFVRDQANGFVQLKQRLNELAQSAVTPASEVRPEPIAEQDLKPGAAVIADEIIVDKEKKEAVLDDFIGGGLAEEEVLAKPPPPPPKPITQQAPEFGSMPAAPIAQPQRQVENMPMQQPAATRSKSNRSLLWPMAAVASLVLVLGAVVLLNLSSALPPASVPAQGVSPLVWIMAAVIVGAIGFWGWRRLTQITTKTSLSSSSTDDRQNRAVMLQNVEDFWLKGVLNPALEAGTLDIGLSSAPGAVLRHKDYGDYELPPNANILDVFNDMNRELLILGAPGGGKTVLLLQLARELIKQAKNPHSLTSSPSGRGSTEQPIPVVFNLSSWAAERKPLAVWLVDELRQKYQVPKKVATAWVEGEKLLLLLDGLDEVAEQYRNACVDAINAYRQQYRMVDLAVCSRVADYDALTSKLDVRGAIVLEPLSQPTIEKYLDRPELASLRQAMASDEALQGMSQVPFLLNAMAYAYAGVSATSLEIPPSLTFSRSDDQVEQGKARRTQLFDRWVARRLAARPTSDYSPSKVRKWLGWLAEKLENLKQTTFFVGRLQPSWLTTKSDLMLYRVSTALITGTFLGVLFEIASYNADTLKFGFLIATSASIVLGVFAMVVSSFEGGLAFGFIAGLSILMSIGSGNITDTRGRTTTPIVFDTHYGIYFGIAACLAIFFFANTNRIYMTRFVSWAWSWKKFRVGLIVALGIALLSGLFQVPLAAFFIAVTGGILYAILPSTNKEQVYDDTNDSRPASKSVIINSIKWAVLVEILFITTPLLGFGYDPGLISPIFNSSLIAIGIFVLSVGGLFAFIQKQILYLLLWASERAPFDYTRFLDYCASVGIMRKVGGGYIFAHRYLLEYFAESSQ